LTEFLKISLHLAKLWVRKLNASSIMCVGHYILLKDGELAWESMAGSNCYNSITLRKQPSVTLTPWSTSIRVVFSWPLVTRRLMRSVPVWTLIVYASVLSRRLSSWLLYLRTVAWFFGVFGVTTVNIFFVSEQNCANIIGWIFFQQLFPMAEFCTAVRSTELWSMRFLSINILQGRTATHWTCGGTFSYCSKTHC